MTPKDLYEAMRSEGVGFFVGVPDSLLKSFSAYVVRNAAEREHLIAANEGGAVALAAGYHLATGGLGAVYLQNSGLGNAVNPLLSLADPEVYGIPLLLILGWRGEPGKHDEPQHVKQGRVMLRMLEAMEIRYEILAEKCDCISRLCAIARAKSSPVALVVPDGVLESYPPVAPLEGNYELTREAAISLIVDHLGDDDVVISTTGKASRELFEHRVRTERGHHRDFLTVGSMGHASQVAFALARSLPHRRVVCIDGDGAILMHLGGLAIVGAEHPENFFHVLLNNGSHESVGGQPTVAFGVNFPLLARSLGYREAVRVETERELIDAVVRREMSFIEVRVRPGSRADLGRPTVTPVQNKAHFMEFLR